MDTASKTLSVNESFHANTVDSGFDELVQELEPRAWVYDRLYLKKYITTIFAPGGVGKSIFALTSALFAAHGTDHLRLGLRQQTNTLVINSEDDDSEMIRRIAGAIQYYGLDPEELNGKFYWRSCYNNPFVVTENINNDIIASPNVEVLVDYMKSNDIKLLVVDPFISSHNALENENVAINNVANVYRGIASQTDAAIVLVHHTRKLNSVSSEQHAGDSESGRGASSLKDASRVVVTLAQMSKNTAQTANLVDENYKRFIRLDNGKQNFGAQQSDSAWFELEPVTIKNGDSVGVLVPKNINALLDDAKGTKWSPETVARSLEKMFNQESSLPWKDIREEFLRHNDIKKSYASKLINTISKDQGDPTTIDVDGVEVGYWLAKSNGQRSQITIHRSLVGK